MSDLIHEQEPPKPSEGDVWLLVLEDMGARRLHGIEKYGTPVQPHNGRDPLVDAYQESLDQCVYLRQAIQENVQVAHLINEMKKYIVVHDILMGECVAWNKLKQLHGVE